MDCSPGSVESDAQLRDTPEPCHAPEWRWPAFFEIKFYSRHPVMAAVPQEDAVRNWIVTSATLLALIVGCARTENPRVVFFQIAGFNLPKNSKILEFTDSHGGNGQFELMAGAGASDGTLVISVGIDANEIPHLLNTTPWDGTFSNSVIEKNRLALAFLTKNQSHLIPEIAVPHVFRERSSSSGTFSNGDLLIVDQANNRIVLICWDT